LPFPSLSDGESLAGWSKNSPIEKAVCDMRHIIIKKLCLQVITFTDYMINPRRIYQRLEKKVRNSELIATDLPHLLLAPLLLRMEYNWYRRTGHPSETGSACFLQSTAGLL
jgi:hypothetical protein